MHKALAARAPALLLALLVTAGCARSAAPEQAAAAAVRFTIAADPQTLDPLFAHADANSVEQQLARLVFEPFIDVDDAGRSVPVLLDRVPTAANGGISADGRTITYHLRLRARWQDGVPVTARDVIWTLHAIVDPRNPVRSRAGYDRVESAVALDAHTVRLRLRAPWAPAVATLFSYGTAPQYVLPAHLLAGRELTKNAFGARPVGNGPYRFVSWARGERLTYAADPTAWDRVAKIAALEVRVIPDPGTNFTLLRSGEVDWNLVSPVQRAALGTPAGIGFRSVPLALVAGLAINTRHAPLDDVRVRRALCAAIDREAISRKITFGRYPVVDTAQPIGSWARDATVREPRFDPLAADRLFDAAGWRRGSDGLRRRNGKVLALTYVAFPESQTGVRVATFVQNALTARGLSVSIKSLSNVQLFLPKSQGGALASGAFDLAYVPWPMGADPDDASLLTCGGDANIMRWCDPQLDLLERRALRDADRARRAQLYARIERRVADAVPIVFLFSPSYSYAYRDRLRNFAPNGFNPTWNAAGWELVK